LKQRALDEACDYDASAIEFPRPNYRTTADAHKKRCGTLARRIDPNAFFGDTPEAFGKFARKVMRHSDLVSCK
jgi:hypothetical protein